MGEKYNINAGHIKHFKKNLVLFFIVLNLICLKMLSAQQSSGWQWVHPKPQGNYLTWCKMWDSNTWYIAGNLGTFMKTGDGGLNWYMTNKAGYDIGGGEFYRDIRDAYFIDRSKGVLASDAIMITTDSGSTFSAVPGTYNTWGWYHFYFLNTNTGYAVSASPSGLVAKTTNGGTNWSFIPVPLKQYSDFYTPNDTLMILSVFSPGGGIRRSSDGGNVWNTINPGSTQTLNRLKFMNNDTGFVCGVNGTVSMTTDGGLNWIMRNNGLPSIPFNDIDYKVTGSNTEIYLTGGPNYIYKSNNLGISWDTLAVYEPGHYDYTNSRAIISTELNGDTILTVGAFGLINKITGNVRQSYLSSLKTGYNMDVWAESGNGKVWAVGAPSGAGVTFDQVMYSPNGGGNWVTQPINSSATFNSIYMFNSNTGYIAGTSGEVRKTVNGGSNWDLISTPAVNDLYRVKFINPNTGWLCGDNGTIYKTTDGSVSWTQQFSPNILTIRDISMIDENTGWIVGDTILEIGFSAGISRTTNGGLNWIPQNIFGGVLYEIEMLDAATAYIAGDYGLLKRTTNGGVSWDSISTPILHGQYMGMHFFDFNSGIISDYEATESTFDGGKTWTVDLLPCAMAYSGKICAVSRDTMFEAGAYGGVFKYVNRSPIGIINWENNIPVKYELYQNYPNPFNPSTTIKFAIPKAGNVLLKVYDITGREVSTIINNLALNAGTVKYSFDGTIFASGIYFYSLYVDGGLIGSKKMILIK